MMFRKTNIFRIDVKEDAVIYGWLLTRGAGAGIDGWKKNRVWLKFLVDTGLWFGYSPSSVHGGLGL
jgi:hypothetical protein